MSVIRPVTIASFSFNHSVLDVFNTDTQPEHQLDTGGLITETGNATTPRLILSSVCRLLWSTRLCTLSF